MWYSLLSLPFIFIGIFTSSFSLADGRTCIFTRFIGGNCYAEGSIVPFTVQYGSFVAGLVLAVLGVIAYRRKRAAR